jgi:hypothetical protein
VNLNDFEAKFRALDCMGAFSAISLVDALPGTPADGDVYLTSEAASPANRVVRRNGSAWEVFVPLSGMLALLADGTAKQFLSGIWNDFAAGGSLALGETSSTAYRGDRGKIGYDHSQTTGNPHGTTAAQVGAQPAEDQRLSTTDSPKFVRVSLERLSVKRSDGTYAQLVGPDSELSTGKVTVYGDFLQQASGDNFRLGRLLGGGNVVADADGNLSLGPEVVEVATKGVPYGVAELDSAGKVPASQLPAFVDAIVEVANFAALPGAGASGTIYVTLDDGITYRWSGSSYTEISASLALGETSSTAYRGDRGKIGYDHSQVTASNPHGTTAAQVGAQPLEDQRLSTTDSPEFANPTVTRLVRRIAPGVVATVIDADGTVNAIDQTVYGDQEVQGTARFSALYGGGPVVADADGYLGIAAPQLWPKLLWVDNAKTATITSGWKSILDASLAQRTIPADTWTPGMSLEFEVEGIRDVASTLGGLEFHVGPAGVFGGANYITSSDLPNGLTRFRSKVRMVCVSVGAAGVFRISMETVFGIGAATVHGQTNNFNLLTIDTTVDRVVDMAMYAAGSLYGVYSKCTMTIPGAGVGASGGPVVPFVGIFANEAALPASATPGHFATTQDGKLYVWEA